MRMAILSLAALVARASTTSAFSSSAVVRSTAHVTRGSVSFRPLCASATDDATSSGASGISRLSTLQTLLTKRGASGSKGCVTPGTLVPVNAEADDGTADDRSNLHPHLYPIVRSTETGHYICAVRRAYAEDQNEYESSTNAPWPIVEAKVGGPGMRLLALNSEHMMRRIAAEADVDGDDEVPSIYNDGLGEGKLGDAGLDSPYEIGSVDKLGYGLERYALLRVGPFPDLYESMARQHQGKGDEQSSLIAAESANGKFTGFGSTFAFYARLLSSFPSREQEAKDAAMMCLRLPVPSMGLDEEEFAEVARLARLAEEGDSTEEAMVQMKVMYDKIREHEKEGESGPGQTSKTREQEAIDEANYLLDETAFTGGDWAGVRSKLAEIYREAGREDMAEFVKPSWTYTME